MRIRSTATWTVDFSCWVCRDSLSWNAHSWSPGPRFMVRRYGDMDMTDTSFCSSGHLDFIYCVHMSLGSMGKSLRKYRLGIFSWLTLSLPVRLSRTAEYGTTCQMVRIINFATSTQPCGFLALTALSLIRKWCGLLLSFCYFFLFKNWGFSCRRQLCCIWQRKG